jgi:rhamnogalacturonyl hydrolase YesR
MGKLSPINFRPIMGVKKNIMAKTMAFCSDAYLNIYQSIGDEEYLRKSKICLAFLQKTKSSRYSGATWGFPFSYQTQKLYYKKGKTVLVYTAFIANSFINAFEVFQKQEYFDIARDAVEFILNDTEKLETSFGICFSYAPGIRLFIHNANLLAAQLLARICSYTKEERLFEYAQRAVNYSMHYQREDGSWYYGEEEGLHWIDGLHTGFNLDALFYYMESTKDFYYKQRIITALDYYRKNLFDNLGRAIFLNTKTYPIDIRSAAQGIKTFCIYATYNSEYFSDSIKIADWTIKNMFDKDGFFYYQFRRLYKIKIPYMRWAESTMLLSLSYLLLKLQKNRD